MSNSRDKMVENKNINEELVFIAKLQEDCVLTGVDMDWEHDRYCDYHITISTKETVNLEKLFALFEKYGDFYLTCNIQDLNHCDLITIKPCRDDDWDIYFCDDDKEQTIKEKYAKKIIFCYLENRNIKRLEESLSTIIKSNIEQISNLSTPNKSIEERVCCALKDSQYGFVFQRQIECVLHDDMLVIEYELPNKTALPTVKEYKYNASSKEISEKKYSESFISQRYEVVLYSIILRTLFESFSIDTDKEINAITLNGYVTEISPSTGNLERKCIVSIQVDRDKFSQINIEHVEPKACFKALKGVSASNLMDISPIIPILRYDKNDKRFVESKDIDINQGTNLAAMHWEDFEHFVRELFELEFSGNGSEVKVTRASRDGGVDAVIYDPDPLRGGKIIIQAKRYTNTVGVSAVRDLYGTVINEGANTGILITTSDYGYDSYDFAKGKPLKLLNGGHLLALLKKNGKNAYIDIDEAKKTNESNRLF